MKNTSFTNKIKNISCLLISLVLLTSIFSCTVGLGPSVDTKAPVVEITSHKDNDSVAEKFTIRGTAYDNEKVTLITIDFEDADIHYQLVPAKSIQKKSAKTGDWSDIEEDNNNYCKVNGNMVSWAVTVDVDNKADSKTDNTYNFKVIANDRLNNSDKSSKKECSLIVDTQSPVVSIYKPELFTGTRSDIETITASYDLKNGNILSRLLNGDIVIYGRQDNTLDTKALRIEFDNGSIPSETSKSTVNTSIPVDSIDEILQLDDSNLGDRDSVEVYYSKTIEGQNLREWSITVKPEDLTKSGTQLTTGKHLIRIVTTAISAANTWERKVIGYFIWYPEADEPWISISVGDEQDNVASKYECYPGSNISGGAQDDDGIKSIVSTVYKKSSTGEYVLYSKEKYENPKTHQLSADNSKYSAWSVLVPSENGDYKLTVTVTDINSKPVSVHRYFKTSDVSAPVIEITSHTDNDSAIVNETGNLTITGSVVDDGSIKNVSMVWLNSALKSNIENKIQFLTGDSSAWNLGGESKHVDANGNIIFKLDDGTGKSSYNINKTINLFNDLGIGTIKNGKMIPLGIQEFIILASDGTTNAIKTLTLSGDNSTPELELTDIKLNGTTQSLKNGNLPTFPKIKNGDTAVISGKWSDKFNDSLVNKAKVYDIELTWGTGTSKQSATAVCKSDGTWSCTITAPVTGGTITAKLKDFGGNEKVIQSAASIEAEDLGLARIGCENEDGAYKAGSEIIISLEFNKTTVVNTTGGKPSLSLNNGKTAIYYGDGSSSVSHKFKYTVSDSDTNVAKLAVTGINHNGAKWYDDAVSGEKQDLTSKVSIVNLPNGTNLQDTKTITIDTKKPEILSVKPLTSAGSYREGASILFMMEFSENVKIENPSKMKIKFAGDIQTDSTSVSGLKNVLFTYKVKAGDNMNPVTFNSIVNDPGILIKDNAGNELTSWTSKETPSFTNIIIDTQNPLAPTLVNPNNSSVAWVPADVIYSETGTSFKILGETGASVEYSLDGGINWLPYTKDSTISIVNNGSYKVTARQIDAAGNVSPLADIKSFTLDKGELLTRITADTPSGIYSTNTAVKTVTGRIEFRKSVIIPKGATVTLNACKSNGTPYVCKIKECESAAASNSVFTFDYVITEGDYINSADKKLNITSWNLGSVNIGDEGNPVNVTVSLPASGHNKCLNENRDIQIITGKPAVVSGGIVMSGVGKDSILRITYDRAISKVSGEIIFTYNETTGNEFHVPTVLTKEEYDELQSIVDLSAYYKPGMSGAEKQGTVLVNDTSTKYILDFDYTDTKSEVVALFKQANKHKMVIPVISEQVTVESNNTLTIRLGENYKLPVNGANYNLFIPAGVVIDSVMNENAEKTDVVVSSLGVEQPQIRLLKPSYEIKNAGTTVDAYADMTVAQTAKMKIDCRTPGAQIKYAANEKESDEFLVNRSIWKFNTKTPDTTIPTTINTSYTSDSQVNLGGNKAVNTYSAAKGLKIAIAATATKGSATSAPAYEYANRTVLKFHAAAGYIQNNGTRGLSKENLTCKQLKMWIIGGDAEYGANTLNPFPLSWQTPSNFKLMAGGHYADTADDVLTGEWWWVTWDVTTKTYHGFALGDVPSDAATKGPEVWYVGECAWVATKGNYILLPGETLVMCLDNSSGVANPYHEGFLFNLKNKGTR